MKFTFKEWTSIKHDLEVAVRVYEERKENSNYSEDENSMYQIFSRQIERTKEFIERIENAEL